MQTRTRILTGLALALGLAASPSLAQTFDPNSSSYNRDGTLNVWGAHIDPVRPQGGLFGGVGSVLGGVVGGTVGAADDIATGSVGARRGASPSRYGSAY